MSSTNVMNIKELKQACKACSLRDLCLPLGVSVEDLSMLEGIISRKRPVQRRDTIYQAGDPLNCLYAVRTGSVKTFVLTNDGEEQVTGFHLPGELLGLDAINDGVHPCTALALETASVCEIPFDRLEELAGRTPGLQHQLLRIMSREIQTDEHLVTLLGHRTSDARLAAFLLNLSRRFGMRGFSRHEFNLTMSRCEIGNYLGLAVETVSRMLSRFQEQGLIQVQRKFITILDADGLREIAGVNGHDARQAEQAAGH
ncbi:fumarate/nitrate reduction transcriptional regulator Fnr [Ectothiorhodospira lacustris]|uniref:fumarate/nitrate reduction transcriptional regulator Fnr n=1 Tax=Ectothiorhodospira lacustris TaxID=2899127 RepID=UPI001EE786B6|nr:fumarate/nitrate reduction transcriptional regulator Fnr [Ectothiorhodospira lacustris]MCG5510770.1 fumarate/nitrate reduction transcriptional regulator Fnr [Ectothiorhodospira lacustris]MCG5522502.1 fumarate/nitrate reduction transcriptional regulator Fnr [Ectothiorhodospira lacustris]